MANPSNVMDFKIPRNPDVKYIPSTQHSSGTSILDDPLKSSESTSNSIESKLNSSFIGSNNFNKISLDKESALPEIIFSTSTTQDKLNSFSSSALNNAFLFSHSRLLSSVSSLSFNPCSSSRSLYEPSKICSGGSLNTDSEAGLTDPFNEAFQASTTDDKNKHFIFQVLPSSTRNEPFAADTEKLRNRIRSLPVNLEKKNIFFISELKVSNLNVSFQDEICRGVEDDKDFDDLVFLEANKVAELITDTSFVNTNPETSFEMRENHILDSIPQPEWPVDQGSSQNIVEDSMKSPKSCGENILKQVDEMPPVNIDEKLDSKNPDKTENISHNISKISTNSPYKWQYNSRNLLPTNAEIVSKAIRIVSDFFDKNENIPKDVKEAMKNICEYVPFFLNDAKGKFQQFASFEDSGQSSVYYQEQQTSNLAVKSCNISSSSKQSNTSQSRSSLSTGKLGKSKLCVLVSKKAPLRAVLPVESMTKAAKTPSKISRLSVTPERSEVSPKFGSKTKKTSTPIYEVKLRPMAASTPTALKTKVDKDVAVSPLARPKLSRSFSYQSRPSSVLKKPENIPKATCSPSKLPKTTIGKPKSCLESAKLSRRNSITEGTLAERKEAEGLASRKRSFSTGKETKIMAALSKVREHILNSPYYESPKRKTSAGPGKISTGDVDNNRTDLNGGPVLKKMSLIAQLKKEGKENQNA